MTDTVFALATAPGRAAVAVIRISGPGARAALARLGVRKPSPRRAMLRSLQRPGGGALDQALVLWFPGPGSYTGEDGAELQVHGGPAIVDGVVGALLAAGLRPAEPGEFTRRAFENGKLDLAQAEAVADLVDAETQNQARQAMAQLGGSLGERHQRWREGLIEALAYLEAALDFPDEEIPAQVEAGAGPLLRSVEDDLKTSLSDSLRGRQIRDSYRIAIIGAPNAGKSTLLNALAERDISIVTELAGTTRDVMECVLDIEGYRIVLADMAGLRATSERIEAEGVRRATAWAQAADLRLWLVDGSAVEEGWREALALTRPGDLCVVNKSDRPRTAQAQAARAAAAARGLAVMDGRLIDDHAEGVRRWLAERVVKDLSGADFPATTRARHAALLEQALAHISAAIAALDEPELAAEDIRLAVRSLGRVTGAVGAEDVLDQVFGRFCIGK